MKQIFLTLVILFSFFNAFSLSKDDVFFQLSKNSETSGNFTQIKTISKLNRNLKSSGKYFFSPDEISWDTEKPFPSKLTINEKEMIQVNATGTESKIDFSKNPTFSSIAKTIKSIFSNDKDVIENCFLVVFSSEKKSLEEEEWTIILTPKDSSIQKAIKNIEVKGISKKNASEIRTMKIAEITGDSIFYEFN